jgi:hypothetical protein
MGSSEIEEFLTCLAVEQNVAASTQNQALHAILFLYRYVLRQELDLNVGGKVFVVPLISRFVTTGYQSLFQLRFHIVYEDEVPLTIVHIVLPERWRVFPRAPRKND